MRIRNYFFWLTALWVVAVTLLLYQVFYAAALPTFFLLEGLVLVAVCLWFRFYRRVVKPLYLLGNGMDLLNEQDFASRLGRVGQLEADRVVEVFNKMMDQLKNERLQVREQNQFLDLLIQASPMGVLICDLDDRLLSLNPAACRLLAVSRRGEWIGKSLQELDNPLVEELREIPMDQSRTIRLGDASIYKCTHSSFIDQGYQHPFFLVESLTEELFKAERKAYEKVIRMISHEV
ncbi:MAG: PAS domain-containing protein, partial [bacterium]|nr:PAS domain-containing protein [bacterium]